MKKEEVIRLYCPHCGTQVEDNAQNCMGCGRELKEVSASHSKTSGKLIAIVAVACCVVCATVAITAIVTNSKVRDSATTQTQAASTQPQAEDTQITGDSAAPEVTEVSNAAPPGDTSWSSAYLWPSDRYYISEADLSGYTQEGVAAIRNEIYARHGYPFQKEKWQNYFAQFSWYQRSSNFSDSMFNEVEKANIDTIVAYEKARGWRGDTAPQTYSYAAISGYLWPTNTCYITDEDLSYYSKDEIAAIRNEIYARHGYPFQQEKWQNYFAQFAWYQPNANFSESSLSEIERTNINTIINYEKSHS